MLAGEVHGIQVRGSASGEWGRGRTHAQHKLFWHVGSSMIIFPPLCLWQLEPLWGTWGKLEPQPTFFWSSPMPCTRVSFFLSCWEKEAEHRCGAPCYHPCLFSWLFSLSPGAFFPAVTLPHCILSGKGPVVWFPHIYVYTNSPGQTCPHAGLPNTEYYQRNCATDTYFTMTFDYSLHVKKRRLAYLMTNERQLRNKTYRMALPSSLLTSLAISSSCSCKVLSLSTVVVFSFSHSSSSVRSWVWVISLSSLNDRST